MTVSTTTVRVSYSGNSSTTSFAVPYGFFGLDDLQVLRVASDGTPTTLVRGTDYTVTGGSGATGNVTTTTAPATGTTLVIRRATTPTQGFAPAEAGPFPATAAMQAWDRAMMLAQEAQEAAGRAISAPAQDAALQALPAAAARANLYLAFDSNGQPIVTPVPPSGSLTVTSLGQSLIQSSTASAARGVLGSTTTGNTLFTAATALAALAALLPVGLITPYAGTSAPSGWLLCYGQNVSRTTYAALFSAIGTTYGTGDGSTTFGLPDLRGRAPFGKDDMGGSAASRVTNAISGITGTTLGAAGGDQRLHQHTHTVTDPGHTHNASLIGGTGGSATGPGAVAYGTTATASATTGITLANAGAGSSQNMPPALIINYLIFAGV